MGNNMRYAFRAARAAAICGVLGYAGLSQADTFYWIGKSTGSVPSDWSNGGGGDISNLGNNWGDAAGNPKVGVPGAGDTAVFGPFGFTNGQPYTSEDRRVNDLFIDVSTTSALIGPGRVLLESGSITYREAATDNRFGITTPLQLLQYGVFDIQGNQTSDNPVDVFVQSTLSGRGFIKRGNGYLVFGDSDQPVDIQLLQDEVIRIEDGKLQVGSGSSGGIAIADFVVGGGTPVGNQVLRPELILDIQRDQTSAAGSGGTYVVRRGGTMKVSVSEPGPNPFEIGQVSLAGGTLKVLDNSDGSPFYFDGISATADVDLTFPAFPQFTASTLEGNSDNDPIRIGDATGTISLVDPVGYEDVIALNTDASLSAGILIVDGGGSMRLTGTEDNFVDTFAVRGATVYADRSFADVFGSDLQIGGVAERSLVVLERSFQMRSNGAPKIFANGELRLLNSGENVGDLTLAEGGQVTGTGTLGVTSIKTLAGGGRIDTPLGLAGAAPIGIDVVADSTLVLSGELLGQFNGVNKTGLGTVQITNGGVVGNLDIQAGTIDLTGNLAQTRVQLHPDATLRSDGGTIATLNEAPTGTGQVVLGDGGLTFATSSSQFSGPITSESGTTGGITIRNASVNLGGTLGYFGRTVINDGGTLVFSGTGIAASSGVTVNGLLTVGQAQNATVTLQSLTGDGEVRLGGKTLNLNRTTGSDTFAGEFKGNNAIIKRGPARTDFTGNSSTFSGEVRLLDGILGINSSSALGNDSSINRLVLDGGTLTLLDDVEMDRTVLLGVDSAPPGGSIDLGRHTLVLGGLVASNPGAVSGLAVVGNGGTLVLNNTANTYTGPTRVSGGATLLVSATGSLGNILNPLRLDNATFGTNAAATTIFNPITVNAGDATFDARGNTLTLANVIGGPGRVTIDDSLGNGSVRFTNANTYQGDTTIAGGTLVVANTTGSATGSGTVFIEGGTLAGTGRIASNSSIFLSGGVISPGDNAGNGIGTLTISLPDAAGFVGLLGLGGGTLDFDLGTQSDLIRFTNLSTALAGDQTVLNLSLTAGFSYDATYTLFANVLDSGSNFAFADITGLSSGYEATVFHDASLNAYRIGFAAVPEPASAVLLGVGALATLQRRRRA